MATETKIPQQSFKKYGCCNCGHVQEIRTNHHGECLDYCQNCSWKPSFGVDDAFPMFGCQAYRRFTCLEQEA